LVILLSSVKFIAGPPFAYAFNQKYDFGVVETMIYSIIGGMLGVVVFSYFSTHLFRFWSWFKARVKKMVRRTNVFSEPTVDFEEHVSIRYTYVDRSRKIFTRRNRRFVRIWNRYGLIGVAFLTPVVFSIPIGTIVANSLVRNKRKIFVYMFFSVVFWSVLINLVFEIYQIRRDGLISW
jgi:hypothetical protein